MKCLKCGAEVTGKFCQYCGTEITYEMKQEQDQLNKEGCPKCGSSNITFKRENQGEVSKNGHKVIIHKTVGLCKDCGHTWFAEDRTPRQAAKNSGSSMIPWVLGWIFIFPIPASILLYRSGLKKWMKVIFIALVWLVYIGIAAGNKGNQSGSGGTAETTSEPAATVAPLSTPSESGKKQSDKQTELRNQFLIDMEANLISYDLAVKEDHTNTWRLMKMESDKDIVDYALQYYKAYFEVPDEVHFIINEKLGTITKLNCDKENLIVDSMEYEEPEYITALDMGMGDSVRYCLIDLGSGEVKEYPAE